LALAIFREIISDPAAMPVRLHISHGDRLATMVAEGKVEAADLGALVARLAQEGAMSYGKLFDIRGVPVDLVDSGLQMHAGRLAAHGQESEIGPLALVVDEATSIDPAALAALAAASRRPCRTFDGIAAARAWLRSLSGRPARDRR
jgi:hypothetical protein